MSFPLYKLPSTVAGGLLSEAKYNAQNYSDPRQVDERASLLRLSLLQ